MFQTKEEKDYSNINQEGNYNSNFEGNISTIYNRPFFIGRDRNRNERMQNFGNYQFRNDYSNEFMNTKDIEEQLKMQIEEEENMEKNWKFIRNKNNNIVIDLKILFKTNKQLEKVLEDNIENDIQEDMYQEVFYKNNYLQKRFEEEITMIKEMQIIYNYEEEKKAYDNNYNNYFNNGGYNTVENEYYQKRNQFLEKKLNEKYLKMKNLQRFLEVESNLSNEIRQNLEYQKSKNQRLIDEIEYIKLENIEIEKKYEEEKRRNQALTQKLKEKNDKKRMDKNNKNCVEIIKKYMKLIKELKKKLYEKK